ncbi:MAG: hypothetical protein GXX92_03110 [Clostridiales bacterium]|nr:hypothetical protein [Clostridiales bacterium]
MPQLQSGIVERIIRNLGPDKKLAFEFFVVFSRFEYTLKLTPCRKCNSSAKADWDKFAGFLKESHPDKVAEIIETADYLLKYPPQRQICKDNVLDWEIPERNRSELNNSNIFYVFDYIKIVRNNLFHGGKYPDNARPANPQRENRLVEVSLEVLYVCLESDSNIKEIFYGV